MRELTATDFESATAKGRAVLDFWAPWCGPCKIFAPIFEASAKEHASILFAKVNVDDEPDLSQRFSIRGIPTMVFLENGKEISRISGAMGKPQFDQLLGQVFR